MSFKKKKIVLSYQERILLWQLINYFQNKISRTSFHQDIIITSFSRENPDFKKYVELWQKETMNEFKSLQLLKDKIGTNLFNLDIGDTEG